MTEPATENRPRSDDRPRFKQELLADRVYWEQAEHVPRELVSEVYREPPDAPGGIERSTLIVGARGAGKTFLLDHTIDKYRGVALKFDLQKQLWSLTGQSRRGP